MGFFQYIESFFFLSLGITFILILLLVFHFRNRISFIELQNDCLGHCVDVLKAELESLKSVFSLNNNQEYAEETGDTEETRECISENISENIPNSKCIFDNYVYGFTCNDPKEITKTEMTQMEEGLLYSSNNSFSMGDISGVKKMVYTSSNRDDNSFSIYEMDSINIDSLNKDMYIPNHERSVYNKIIVLDEDVLDVVEEILSEPVLEPVSESVLESVLEPVSESVLEPVSESVLEPVSEPIHETLLHDPPLVKESVSYQKMNVQALRAYIISIGLCSDPSKLKKTELIKRLTEHDLENK